jgi:hypothetical protein
MEPREARWKSGKKGTNKGYGETKNWLQTKLNGTRKEGRKDGRKEGRKERWKDKRKKEREKD